ncbi:cell division protein FtsK [Bifidobacterium sp. DSM 109959]|uniref:Cell division protein FtsK n=2 Tax=Bifidobacterium olomucense TaxID=2675324 RepID=A0A7Y0EXK4_9BIFI|nr:ATP-binding protein [Bifidobacterium sp. DSM 109959]NMM98260.1 cell division protein FtsK [Bifidobacterium sp. DSM 109959]
MVFATVCPLAAQVLMIVVMAIHGQWLFAAMIIPGAIGYLASMLSSASAEKHPSQPTLSPAHEHVHSAEAITGESPHKPQSMEAAPTCTVEALLDFDHLPWRTIIGYWTRQSHPVDLAVPIGMTAHGPFILDLAKQGPHALVAGTTGSGKSVLLQNWCLMLAAKNRPESVNFVFLDFKGGSAFQSLEQLPHTVGSVSDLDLAHAARALRALETELTRREQLVAAAKASSIDDMPSPPARLIVVIDEFHALKDRLANYIDRLTRIASLGRSLGMHVIACTQNPIGQVNADMKANMSISICLRVRDRMQSVELLGDGRAAQISPSAPGAAFCNDAEAITALRCASIRDIARVQRHIGWAARFMDGPVQPLLFTAPLPRKVSDQTKETMAGMVSDHIWFGLADNGITLGDAAISLRRGNVAVIGAMGRGKTTLLNVLAKHAANASGLAVYLYIAQRNGRVVQRFRAETTHDASPNVRMRDVPKPPHTVWIVDDADDLLDPFNTATEALAFRRALADSETSVVFAVSAPRLVRVPEHCTTRIIFPFADRTTDLMAGIPADLLHQFGATDMNIAGRGVFIDGGTACLVQCAAQNL